MDSFEKQVIVSDGHLQVAVTQGGSPADHDPARCLPGGLRLAALGVSALAVIVASLGAVLAEEPKREGQESSATQAQAADESWEVLYLGGSRAGYGRSTSRWVKRDGQKQLVSEEEVFMTIKRFGQELKIQRLLRTEETEYGRLIRFVFVMKNPPATTTRSVGTLRRRIDGSYELEVETTVGGRRSRSTLRWENDARSPAYQDRLLEQNPLKPGDKRSFKTFVPELLKFTDVKLVAYDYRPVKLLDGQTRRALKVRVTQSILPTVATDMYLDEQGETLKTETDLLGMKMISYTVPKEVALEKIAGAELDLALDTLVRVAPIREPDRARQIVYRIRIPEDDPARYLLEGPTQHVVRVAPDTVELTVRRLPVPSRARIGRIDREYTSETQYLQLSDPRVQEHARRAAGNVTDPGLIALRMEKYVHEKLTNKNFSTMMASAAEVAEKLEGDCTEHAVLLAALLRVKRIPSRVAVGLVYVESLQAFGGHMWTEAYLNGQWVPLDATLGKGGTGPTHIKLAVSSLADEAPSPVNAFLPLMNVLGKIQIEVVKVEP
ncbi:MAG: transglutaminase family protein [Planctomycetes bacterium]|nr:transglutaminase family protein [Planctomycetota bacterium]